MTHLTDILPAIAEFWIYAAFTLILLPRKYNRPLSYGLIVVMSILNGFAFLLPQLSWYRTLAGFTLVAALVLLLFDGKFSKKLIVLVAINVTLILNEFFFAFIFLGTDVVTNYNNLPDAQRITIAIADRLSLALLFILEARIFKRRFAKEDNVEYDSGFQSMLLVCTIPIIMIILWYRYVVVAVPDARPVGVLLPLFACIFAEIALVLLQISSTKQKNAANELQRLKELTEAQKKYYSALSDSYNQTRKMRHDIQNHMFTVQALLADNKASEAAKYADDITETYKHSLNVRFCEHSILDSYLYYRAKILRENSIKAEFNISVSDGVGIDSTDLIGAFGNLIDNAEEACIMSDEKSISVSVSEKNGWLFIDVQNTFREQGKTSKAERIPGLGRGVGNVMLQDLAEKYNGNYSTEAFGNVFHATLVLSEETDD